MELSEYADAVTAAETAARILREMERPGARTSSQTATVIGAPDQLDIPSLLAEHNLDPDEWLVKDVIINRWESSRPRDQGLQMHRQLKLILTRKVAYALLLPAPEPRPWRAPAPRPPTTRPTLIMVTGDPQIPFHDEALHQLSCRFAHDNQVDGWVDLGDLLDLPSLSKHRQKPEFHATLQETIDTGGRILAERASAAPPYATLRRIGGNHDVRLRNWLLDHAPQLWGIRRAQIGPAEHLSVLDLDYLLHSQELGWQSVTSPHGEYPFTSIEIAPNLIGIHGTSVRPGAGNSVRAELDKRDHSIIQGHVNKLAVYARTRIRANGEPFTVWAAESGMMGRVDGGMGFQPPGADWVQGFLTVTVWPSGAFHIETVPYIDGALRWRDQEWTTPQKRKRRAA